MSKEGNICTDCSADPNSQLDSQGNCVCKPGYGWSETTYPFKCEQGLSPEYCNANNVKIPCSSLPSNLTDACIRCDLTKGFLFVSRLNICMKCDEVNGATGRAFLNGCECDTNNNYAWDPSRLVCRYQMDFTNCTSGYIFNIVTEACDICDPIRSANNGTACIFCSSVNNSLGFSDSTGQACACKPSFNWTGYDCSANLTCDTDRSIWIGNVCFACPDGNNGGLGAPDVNDRSKCGCLANFTWVPDLNGGSCQCLPNYYN